MFEVCVEHTFAAAHALRHYHGKCERVHGHNYRVQVTVEGPEVDPSGMLVDFVELKRLLRAAAERLDHQFLNEITPFDVVSPSAENIAKYFFEELHAAMPQASGANLQDVKVWETDIQYARYRSPKNAD